MAIEKVLMSFTESITAASKEMCKNISKDHVALVRRVLALQGQLDQQSIRVYQLEEENMALKTKSERFEKAEKMIIGLAKELGFTNEKENELQAIDNHKIESKREK